ncbi:HNH endonuclease [Candidatus Parcubacteria bacterium]|nr:MAG: HNH endonuclease [Candidatus Parcubacteria bacterium]
MKEVVEIRLKRRYGKVLKTISTEIPLNQMTACNDIGEMVAYLMRSTGEFVNDNAALTPNLKRETLSRRDRTDEIAALKAMPYSEYLTTKHWKSIARRARLRAKHKCQLCNNTGESHVHHRHYKTIGEESIINDLIVLCADCHAKFHGTGLPEDSPSDR